MPIHFGTDGWRAVISDTFTFSNLRMVAQAIADAVASEQWDKSGNGRQTPDPKKIVVGFDTRFLSDRYAGEVARVLAANGFTVMLAQADAPTPTISYAVKNQNAIAGVMITASHNAPRYNGVKLKGAFGGSALPEQCRRVEVYINDNEEQARGPNLMDFKMAREANLIQKFNPLPAYFDHLRTLINTDIIADNPQRFVVDAMYGSGRGVIKSFLQGTGCEITEIRGEMNPGFGSVHPEPIAKYLGALASAVSSGMGNFGVVTDGDADRIGAMDERGSFVDPHKIMALSLKYLVEKRGMTGAVVRTVSTTRMIDRLAKRYGLKLYETPVGFNHIADYMMTEDVLIGGEESGGISFKGHIPEGDGPIMGLLLVEMIAASGKTLQGLVEELLDDVGPAFYERTDLRLSRPVAKAEMAEFLTKQAPAEIGGEKMSEISPRDGVKYIMADDSWLLIRPSGTEPVLRVYAEGRTQEMVRALLDYGQQVAKSVVGVSGRGRFLSPLLGSPYERTTALGRGKFWLLILGLFLVIVILINGMAIIPQQPYQELSQNPFTTRTDIHFNNYWQETVLLPIIAFYLGLTSPTTFNTLCFILIVGAYSLFALSSSRRWGSAVALVFTTLLITSPLTTTGLTWLGTPDGLTIALTVPFLFSNSGILLFFLAILGATNHPAFIIASTEILLIRWIGRDRIKVRHLISAAVGSAAGYGLVRLFLFVNGIEIVSRFDFILLKSMDGWMKMNATNLPMSITSLFNVHWLILLTCFLMFFKKDKLYYSSILAILLVNYAIVFFTLDTTRIFSLLSWGMLFHCIFHSYELAVTEYGNDSNYQKQFLQALIVIGIASFISPRYFSWLGEIHTTPFYQFMRKLLR